MAEQPEEEGVELRELLQMLNRRREAIAGIFLLVLVLTGLYLYQATPTYTATSKVTLNLRQSNVVDMEEVVSGVSANTAVLNTEMDVIRSGSLLKRMVKELSLDQDPEFNPALEGEEDPGLLAGLRGWISGLWFLESKAAEDLSQEEKEKLQQQRLLENIQAKLQVDHRRQSHTISISFTSQDPEQAAEIANTLAELYQTDRLEAKFEATRQANEWLSDRLENLRQEVRAKEQAVKNAQQKSDMVQSQDSTVLEQQISDVNAQLIQARVRKSKAEARLARAREVMDQPSGLEGLSEVIDSETIQDLREEESAIRRKKADLSKTYGPKHPKMIQIKAELKGVREKLEEEAKRILESLKNEVQVARAEVRSLERSLQQLKSEAEKTMQAELEVKELKRQAESARNLYQKFLSRFQETREQKSLQRPDVRIISRADVPTSPSHPRKKMTLGLGGILGLLLGFAGAYVLESLDNGFRTGDQVERSTGLPVLGSLPLLSSNRGSPAQYVLQKPFSSFSESLRAIRTAIHLSNVDHPPQILMVTSALPKEGKSVFSLALARMSSTTGAKTLIIDADLRRPALAESFPDLDFQFKLEDVLQGKTSVKDALVKDPESELHLLTAHGKAPAVAEMLGSKRMRSLLQKLKEHYDLVVLDTPPVMGVSDAWTIARHVDSVLFLVRWAETPRETVRTALRQIEQLGIGVGGIVMSMVNIRRQSKYGYSGYGYYYGKYRKYYQE